MITFFPIDEQKVDKQLQILNKLVEEYETKIWRKKLEQTTRQYVSMLQNFLLSSIEAFFPTMQEFMLTMQEICSSKIVQKVLYCTNFIMNIIMFTITGLFLYHAYTDKIYIKE